MGARAGQAWGRLWGLSQSSQCAGRAPSARPDFPCPGKAQGQSFVSCGRAGAAPVLRRTRALLGALSGTAPCPSALMRVSPHPAHASSEKIPGSGQTQLRESLL